MTFCDFFLKYAAAVRQSFESAMYSSFVLVLNASAYMSYAMPFRSFAPAYIKSTTVFGHLSFETSRLFEKSNTFDWISAERSIM